MQTDKSQNDAKLCQQLYHLVKITQLQSIQYQLYN
jgi:hypothetical protein